MPSTTECPHCGLENPPGAAVCTVCSTPLPIASPPHDTSSSSASNPSSSSHLSLSGDETLPSTSGWSAPASPAGGAASLGTLQPGRVLGNRYEILQLLGEGGMGAVYKARDREVDRLVALKLIRPELASRADILARFKQELILARQVTHKNVIRIFDLGEADGLKFITMDFIEGRDLKSILREKGKFPSEEAVKVATQICRALDAAHSEGVVHRDLKPQNIMVDAKGRVTVMDFGIARSMEMPGMTQTGSLVGTPEYMSPEQAKGEDVDARSDIFTLGIIFYELLTGKTPFYADTAYATLLKRTQERARDPVELEPSIPPYVSGVIMKCLETNRDQRYLSALDIIHDLGQQTATGSRTALPAIAPALTSAGTAQALPSVSAFQRYRLWIGAGAALLVLVIVAVVFRSKLLPTGTNGRAQEARTALAVLPFKNATGDTKLDWLGPSISELLRTGIGESASFYPVSTDRLRQILGQLSPSSQADLDSAAIDRIAKFTGANLLVWGQYSRQGDQIHITGKMEDLRKSRTVTLNSDTTENKLVAGVDQLAGAVRENLHAASGMLQQMKASAFTPTSTSIEAIRDFTNGLELAGQRNDAEAAKQFDAATKADPNFALAYSRLARTYAQVGNQAQAEQAASTAMSLADNLPPAEKYMVQATNGEIESNYARALSAYTELAGLMPSDPRIQREFAELYKSHGAYDKAREHYQTALQIDPRDWETLRGLGELEITLGSAQSAIDHLNRALSGAIELNDQRGKAAVLKDLGGAYNLLNRPDDALRNFQQALDINQQIGDKVGIADALDQIAGTEGDLGKSAEAEQQYQQELKMRNDIGDKAGLASAYTNLGALLFYEGRYDDALSDTKQALQIQIQRGNEPAQALCLMNIGQISFQLAKFEDALTYQQRALDLYQKLQRPLQIAQMANNVGLTYATIGQFDQATSSYALGLEQARKLGDNLQLSAILDDMAALDLIQGRYGDALKHQQDALHYAQQLQAQQGAYFAQIQADYANVLNQLGRFSEAQPLLDQSLKTAVAAQGEDLEAIILNFQGEGLYYSGDFKSAQPLFERAQQSSVKAKDRLQSLYARLHIAKISVAQGRAASTVGTLRGLLKEATDLGAKYIATQCSVALGDALLGSKDYAHARQELGSALRTIQDLGMKSLEPRTQYLLSQTLRASGNASEADVHLNRAVSLLKQMQQDAHADTLVARFDLKPILAQPGK
jgi:eukaryotic-like serine/threonine-protein kinase